MVFVRSKSHSLDAFTRATKQSVMSDRRVLEMPEDYTLIEFMQMLAEADGDKALEIIGRYQAGGLWVEGMPVDEWLTAEFVVAQE